MLRISPFLVAAALAGGCNHGAPAPSNVRGCWGTDCAIVTTSHYNPDFSGVGTINAVQMSQSKIVRGIDSSLDPDVGVQIGGTKLYVLNRDVGSLRTYDLATLKIEEEIATGAAAAPNTASAPFGFWRSDTSSKIYVTLAGNDAAHALGVVDEATPDAGVVTFVNVPAAAADTDGSPDLSQLYACNG
ncbi:MAG TPA: hypothetical protein VF997_03445, partial [Polyangia bacterium]